MQNVQCPDAWNLEVSPHEKIFQNRSEVTGSFVSLIVPTAQLRRRAIALNSKIARTELQISMNASAELNTLE